MASEARRGVIRMAANYSGMLLQVCIGLVFVRLLLQAVGDQAFGLVLFLGPTIGITEMLCEIIERSMIRELGEAYHRDRGRSFVPVYNSALVLCTGIAVLTLVLFGVLWLAMGWTWLKVPASLVGPLRWFIVARAFQTMIVIQTAPTQNMYIVQERMAAYNFWLVAQRAATLIAVLLLLWRGSKDPGEGVILLGVWLGAMAVMLQLISVGWLMVRDPRMRPALRAVRWQNVKSVLAVGGWNTAVVTAMNLHLRIDAIIMQAVLGPLGSRIWNPAFVLTSYARRTTMGVTTGLDAVSVRISNVGGEQTMGRLVYHATRLHGLAAFPAIAGIVVLATPIVQLWLGGKLENGAAEVPMIVMLVRVLALGIAARSISDGWMMMLYGAGHIRRYAGWILAGGLANPCAAAVLLYVLPHEWRFIGPAAAFAILMMGVHFLWLPKIGAPLLGLRTWDMFSPLVRPAVATIIVAPALILAVRWIEDWDLVKLLVVIAGYAMTYMVLTWLIVLNCGERSRVMRQIYQRVGLWKQ